MSCPHFHHTGLSGSPTVHSIRKGSITGRKRSLYFPSSGSVSHNAVISQGEMEVVFEMDVDLLENERFETNAHVAMSFEGIRERGDTDMLL